MIKQRTKTFFTNIANTFPIHKRLNSYELDVILKRALIERNIITPFEFGVFSDGLATKVTSNNYTESQKGPQYSVPLFLENEGVNTYDLSSVFSRKKHLSAFVYCRDNAVVFGADIIDNHSLFVFCLRDRTAEKNI